MNDALMNKTSQQIEAEFLGSAESAIIKSNLLNDLQNSSWEATVRKEIKQYLEKADDTVTTKEVFEAVKDVARREVPTEIKKKLYEQVLQFVQTANK